MSARIRDIGYWSSKVNNTDVFPREDAPAFSHCICILLMSWWRSRNNLLLPTPFTSFDCSVIETGGTDMPSKRTFKTRPEWHAWRRVMWLISASSQSWSWPELSPHPPRFSHVGAMSDGSLWVRLVGGYLKCHRPNKLLYLERFGVDIWS